MRDLNSGGPGAHEEIRTFGAGVVLRHPVERELEVAAGSQRAVVGVQDAISRFTTAEFKKSVLATLLEPPARHPGAQYGLCRLKELEEVALVGPRWQVVHHQRALLCGAHGAVDGSSVLTLLT